MRAAVGSGVCGGNVPAVAVKTICLLPARPVVVGALHTLVELLPFLSPAVEGGAVYAALVGDHLNAESLNEQQPKGCCSGLGEVRIDRIGHDRPPFCN